MGIQGGVRRATQLHNSAQTVDARRQLSVACAHGATGIYRTQLFQAT